jgi:hypothetical protein
VSVGSSSAHMPPKTGSTRDIYRSFAEGLASMVILLAVVAAYANGYRGPSVLDAIPQIPHNPSVHRLWPLSVPPTASRPVVRLTWSIKDAFGGEDVRG